MHVDIEYGDTTLAIDVPDGTPIVAPGAAYEEPPGLDDPVDATRTALRQPLGSRPLHQLVGPSDRVVIGFPDRVKGGGQATAHRKVAIPLILDELARAGVEERNVTLVCGMGLHRKNTREEFAAYLGDDLVARFGPTRLVNHDAEDPGGMVRLGSSELGDVVDFNRTAFEADLTIMLGHTMGNPYGGYSGGYKMPCTGFTSWRSIRGHHTPRTMYRDDFVPVSSRSRFRDQLTAIGRRVEAEMNRPFFLVDAVLNGRSEQMHVVAGTPAEVEAATWDRAAERTEVALPGPKANVLVVGIPRTFHYGPGMGSNPLLMLQGLGSWVTRAAGAMEDDFVVIGASVCDGWFNDAWFPSYRATYEKLQELHAAEELVDVEASYATNPEWVHAYREAFAYHPFHGFSMAYMGGVAIRRALEVMIVGARAPGFARGVGARPVASFEDALARAGRLLGRPTRPLVVPAASKPAVHLGVDDAS
jgi:nickel-dependent lactate racemase